MRPGGAVFCHRLRQCVRIHPELGVGRDLAQGLVAESEENHRLVDRGMGLVGAVHAIGREVRLTGHPSRAHSRHCGFTRRSQRVERGHRRGVVDHTFERIGESDQLAQPPEGDLFEFGDRWRRSPQHALRIERGRQEIGKHAGTASRAREVGEEPRVIPVCDPWNDQAVEVGQDRLERFALFRSVLRKTLTDVTAKHFDRTGYCSACARYSAIQSTTR